MPVSEKRKQQMKDYRSKNKEKLKEYHTEYNQKNKERILEYRQSPEGLKTSRIINWKQRGLICDDIDALYDHYTKTTHCDECSVELTYDKRLTRTTKCMDHCHETGQFRNILCHSCNTKRR